MDEALYWWPWWVAIVGMIVTSVVLRAKPAPAKSNYTISREGGAAVLGVPLLVGLATSWPTFVFSLGLAFITTLFNVNAKRPIDFWVWPPTAATLQLVVSFVYSAPEVGIAEWVTCLVSPMLFAVVYFIVSAISWIFVGRPGGSGGSGSGSYRGTSSAGSFGGGDDGGGWADDDE